MRCYQCNVWLLIEYICDVITPMANTDIFADKGRCSVMFIFKSLMTNDTLKRTWYLLTMYLFDVMVSVMGGISWPIVDRI